MPLKMARSVVAGSTLAIALFDSGCRQSAPHSTFIVARVDRQLTGNSNFPLAIDPDRVGTYSAATKSGAGYFYDDVLEYRVWLHPENGAEPLNGDSDYFVAFAQYEPAEDFSKNTSGAEPPLALVRQLESINEPKPGQFVQVKGTRITEWQVVWLKNNKRTEKSIQEFLEHPYEAGPQ